MSNPSYSYGICRIGSLELYKLTWPSMPVVVTVYDLEIRVNDGDSDVDFFHVYGYLMFAIVWYCNPRYFVRMRGLRGLQCLGT